MQNCQRLLAAWPTCGAAANGGLQSRRALPRCAGTDPSPRDQFLFKHRRALATQRWEAQPRAHLPPFPPHATALWGSPATKHRRGPPPTGHWQRHFPPVSCRGAVATRHRAHRRPAERLVPTLPVNCQYENVLCTLSPIAREHELNERSCGDAERCSHRVQPCPVLQHSTRAWPASSSAIACSARFIGKITKSVYGQFASISAAPTSQSQSDVIHAAIVHSRPQALWLFVKPQAVADPRCRRASLR